MISLEAVAHTNVWVYPYTKIRGEWVVIVNETAFRGFEMAGCERVWNSTETQRGERGVEWSSGEGDYFRLGELISRCKPMNRKALARL